MLFPLPPLLTPVPSTDVVVPELVVEFVVDVFAERLDVALRIKLGTRKPGWWETAEGAWNAKAPEDSALELIEEVSRERLRRSMMARCAGACLAPLSSSSLSDAENCDSGIACGSSIKKDTESRISASETGLRAVSLVVVLRRRSGGRFSFSWELVEMCLRLSGLGWAVVAVVVPACCESGTETDSVDSEPSTSNWKSGAPRKSRSGSSSRSSIARRKADFFGFWAASRIVSE